MKQRFRSVVVSASVGFLVLGCAGLGQNGAKQAPSLVVTTPVVQLSPGGKVVMYGTGFTPNQEVMLLFRDPGGGLSSIGGAVSPAPVPNKDGAWAAEWNYAPYLKMLKPGTAMLSVADQNFKTLDQAPVVFVAPKKPQATKGPAKK
jgi:hypothetical protein